ncbi:MAG: class I SAM-dependent methyltransferase [Deferribacterales bacterium]
MPPIAPSVSVQVTPAAEKSIKKGHPWVYADAVAKISREANTGDIAAIFSSKRDFIGLGLYDPTSPIRIRVLTTKPKTTIDNEWLKAAIQYSISVRQSLINDKSTDGFRLLHGENDGIPGLVADIYRHVLVIKLDTSAWIPHLELICKIFEELVSPQTMVLRLSRTVAPQGSYSDGCILYGEPVKGAVVFSENGILFEADPVNGQKTGFFLDQRENRARAGRLAKGRDVLNIFAYNGGFSLYAAKGGARSVISLDIAPQALEASKRNFALNPDLKCPHETLCADAFAAMKELADKGRKFGMVIVDPPSFARKQADIPNALAAYEKLTKLAVNLTAKDGILICASCSARVSADDFFTTVLKTAKRSERKFIEIERTLNAPDHPVGFAEGAYLKCIYMKVS